jgi:opacity protein-like surface antigen
MKRTILIILFLGILTIHGFSQFISNYGLNFGATYSGQLWWPKNSQVEIPATDYKFGYLIFLSTEKNLNKIFSIRPEIGYIQKGFKNLVELHFPDGSLGNTRNKNVTFHNMALNLGFKFSPFKVKFSPYAILGIHIDYMFAYKDISVEESGSGQTYNMYKSQIDNFNKWNLGLMSIIGLQYKGQIYLEFEFNQSQTDKYKSSTLRISDECWSFKLGFNINKMIK